MAYRQVEILPIKQAMVWIATFIVVGLLFFLAIPQFKHYESQAEVLLLIYILVALLAPVLLQLRKNNKQQKEYILLCATVYMVFIPLLAQKIVLWLFLLHSKFIGILTIALLVIMLLLLLITLIVLITKCFDKKSARNTNLLFILYSYISIVLMFSSIYFFVTFISDFRDARDKYWYLHDNQAVVVSGSSSESIFNNINRLSFNGMNDRLWSGVDYPMNDISFLDKDIFSYKSRLSRDEFDKVVHYIPENSLKVYLDCIHFSIATITTTGYGDITPRTWFARLVANSETIIGQLLSVLALGMFFTQKATTSPSARQVQRGITTIRLRKPYRR